MTPLSPEQIAEWKRLAEEAPEEPTDVDFVETYDETYVTRTIAPGAVEFYAAARSAVPALLAEVERLRALLREVEWKGIDGMCPLCGADYPSPGGNPYVGAHTPFCRLAAAIGPPATTPTDTP